MWIRPQSVLLRYGIVPAVVALAFVIRCFFLSGEMPFLLLWPAVIFCAWFGGFGPGLLTTCLSALLTACLYFEPPHWFSLTKPEDWRGMALFILLGSVLSLLCEGLYRAKDKLRQRAKELVEADERKNQFLAMLAHELRNPMAPIRNAAKIVKSRGVPESQLQWAGNLIERQVQQAMQLVDDLLDVTRLSRGKVKLQRERIPLAPVVAQAVESSRPLIEARQHQLQVVIPEEPIWLEADPTRLTQVLVNLLNNSAKYTDKGGCISLTIQASQSQAVIKVKDNGIGMVPEMLPRIFDMFAQAQRALNHSQGGLGIGLSLVKSLVEMHGGTVTAFSAGPCKGSEFTVRLPVGESRAGSEPNKLGSGLNAVSSRASP
jgi:signal transduction histidine kinase